MTREEAIKMLKSKMDGHTDTSYEWAETVRMAISALEQNSCEDAVSRQAVINMLDEMIKDRQVYFGHNGEIEYSCGFSTFKGYVEQLPSVTVRQTGEWIRKESMGCPIEICSKCGEMGDMAYNFCPNCGADMRGESE